MATVEQLIDKLRECAGFENVSGARAAAAELAALDSDAAVTAMVSLLKALDDIDLSEDAGDISDEVWRARQALTDGLRACGQRAIEPLRPLLVGPPSPAGLAALRVLASLGDRFATPVAIDWARRGERSAFVPLGVLGPAEAIAILSQAIERAVPPNDGWDKRVAAHALGELKTEAAVDLLEKLLADSDWFARLGAAEALCKITGERARRLLERASRDLDPRVAAAADGVVR